MKSKARNGKYPVKFFLLVYGLSTPLWLLQLFIGTERLPLNIPITDIVAAFTPLVAACFLTYKEKGKAGVYALLKRVFDYKKIGGINWLLTVMLIPAIIFSVILLALKFYNVSIPSGYTIPFQTIPFLVLFFFLGAIGEEVGYMGYAVDAIQKEHSAFSTGIIIGIPWMFWHYPSIIHQGRSLNFIFWGMLGTVAFRIIYVWLYNNTNQSLFACILPHCLYNTGRVIFPHNATFNPLVDYPSIHYSVIVLTAAVITVLWGRKTLASFVFTSKSPGF